MKKMIIAAAIICAAVFAQAAAVGWSAGNIGTTYAGDAYMFFVIGQNGVESTGTVTGLLNSGKDVSSYAFGKGTTNGTTGALTVSPTSAAAGALDPGTYTAFFVLFDSATPAAGESKYLLISGQAGLTDQTIAPTAASKSFAAGNVASVVTNADNWKSFGEAAPGPGPDPIDTPEPTSGLLLLVGGAMLALRRKQK